MTDKCVAIIAGTRDIHQPLYLSLKRSLSNPVYLIEFLDHDSLIHQLTVLAKQYEVWVFPSNEIMLNAVHAAMNGSEIIESRRLRIPGTAYTDRAYSSVELSNKALMFSLLEGVQFKSIKKLKTQILCWNGNESQVILPEGLSFPIIIKPAVKDKNDSFTKAFPAKIRIIETLDQLLRLIEQQRNLFYNREYLLQELAKGQNISWYGYVYAGHAHGYCIVPVIKSPVGSFGGTTTLARLKPTDAYLAAAIDELVRILNLDGIFEIEFDLCDGRPYFLYEINPRPILQVSLVLQQKSNIFVKYLLKQGFTPAPKQNNSTRLPEFWGSALRYLSLNAGKNISLVTLFRTAIHDVHYTEYVDNKQKIFYTFSLAKLLFRLTFTS